MVLRLTDVGYRCGGRWVLAHVDLAVAAGSRVLLTGANGAGKTTLLRLAATALRPARGQIALFGRDARPDPAPARAKLALWTHQHHFYEALSAAENLELVARLGGARGRRPAELLGAVGLGSVGAQPVSAFSAGMKRRLGLARVLARRPALALLDEPFGQLDPAGVALVAEVTASLARAGCAVLFTAHDVARGRALADAHVHLKDGELSAGAAAA